MTITSTIWPLQPHTEAKHVILRKYLNAWLPIITSWARAANFIDGFAGPGKYTGGEDGSPVIAIKAVIQHKKPITSKIKFLFIEKEQDRYEFLKEILQSLTIPPNLEYHCECNEFAKVMERVLDELSKNKQKIAPTFVFIDPFGFSGAPFSIIEKIMESDYCEVLITFMYEEINRFIDDVRYEKTYDSLFSSSKWKEVRSIKDPKERYMFLRNIYLDQLKRVSKFVRSFEMKNKFNKTDYFLFFATNNKLGLERMKEAMWRVDPKGTFEFSDATYDPEQTVLFEIQPNYIKLKNMILEEYKGKKVSGAELEDFVIIKTAFTKFHYKSSILKPMEEKGEIKVTCEGKRRPYTYPNRVIIEFF